MTLAAVLPAILAPVSLQSAVDLAWVSDLPPATLVGIGGALGALLRYGTTRALDAEAFPFGTLVVNVVGSFALGLLAFGGAGGEATLLLGVGACGAFTTFSSFAHDTVRMAETGEPRRAVIYALGSLGAALAAVGVAWLAVG